MALFSTLMGLALVTKILAPVFLLGFLVFIHEFGHFLFAKIFGVAVEQFSFGFGPRLFGVRVGETDYRLNLVPLGGYVKMYGDDPYDLESAERPDGFLSQSVWKRLIIVAAGPVFNLVLPITLFTAIYMSGSPELVAWVGTVQRGSPAAAAGVSVGDEIIQVGDRPVRFWTELAQAMEEMSLQPGDPLTLTLEDDAGATRQVSFVPEFEPVEGAAPQPSLGFSPTASLPILTVIPGGSAAAAGLRDGDRVLSINGAEIQWWHEVQSALATQEVVSLKVERAPAPAGEGEEDTEGDVLAELTFAGITPGAPSLSWVGEGAPPAWLVPAPAPAPEPLPEGAAPGEIAQAPEPALASAPAGLSAAALIAANPTFRYGLLPRELSLIDAPETLPAYQAGVRDGDTVVALNGAPISGWPEIVRTISRTFEGSVGVTLLRGQELLSVVVVPEVQEQIGPTGQPIRVARVGIGSAAEITGRQEPVRLGLIPALSRGTRETGMVIATTMHILGEVVSGAIPVEDSIGGPIAIVKAAQVSASVSIFRYFKMMALISVSLGLINLFPIPMLDGGNILFFSVEAIRGQPVSLKFREVSNQVGALLLLSLIVFAIINDTRIHILNN